MQFIIIINQLINYTHIFLIDLLRDIAGWERVLYDEALVMAPADHPVCVGCLSKVGILSMFSVFKGLNPFFVG